MYILNLLCPFENWNLWKQVDNPSGKKAIVKWYTRNLMSKNTISALHSLGSEKVNNDDTHIESQAERKKTDQRWNMWFSCRWTNLNMLKPLMRVIFLKWWCDPVHESEKKFERFLDRCECSRIPMESGQLKFIWLEPNRTQPHTHQCKEMGRKEREKRNN